MKRIFFCLSAWLVLSVSFHPAFCQEKITVLQVDLLIDGTGREPIKDAVIVIEGNRVKEVGRKGVVPIPQGAKVIGTKGRTALPGFIDAHSHYTDWQGELYLNQGVTTALAIGSLSIDWITAQREGIAKGKIVGPRIFAAGPHLNSPRPGERASSIRDLAAQRRTEISVRTAEEARKAVQELILAGADIIKVYEYTTPEAIKAAAEEAHKAGKPIGGHSENIFVSGQNGYDFVEHGYAVVATSIKDPKKREELSRKRMAVRDGISTPEYHSYADMENFDELIRFMVEHKIYLTPTLATFWRTYSPKVGRFKEQELALLNAVPYLPPYFKANVRAHFDGTATIAKDLRDRVLTGYQKTQEFVRRFVQAGGKIRAGSDPTSILPALAVHTEMELLVEAGLTPMEAILAATRNSAELLRKEDDLGVIKPGSLADILVVEGNPLEDIRKTRNIKMVFKEGNKIKLGYSKEFKNPIPLLGGDRPQPEIDRITPESVTQKGGPITLTIEGANFMSTSIATLDGKPLPTKVEFFKRPYPQNFDRGRRITAIIDPKLIEKPGTYTITVVELGRGGVVSNPQYLIVKFR